MAGRGDSVGIGDLPVGVVLLDADDVVIEANAAFEEWAAVGTVVGRRAADLMTPTEDFLEHSDDRTAKMMLCRGDRSRAALVIRAPRGDGALLTVMDATDRYVAGHDLRRSFSLAARTRTRLELVIEASIAFAEASSEERLAEILAVTTARAYAAEESVVFLVDEHGSLEVAAGTNPFDGMIDTRAFSQQALGLNYVLKLTTPEQGDALGPTLSDAMRATGVQALIAAPIHHEDDRFGLFVCFFHHPRQFDDEASPLADALAGQAAQTLTTLRLQRQLEHAATHDETTGLPNRRMLEHHSTLHSGGRRSVVFVDLDGFKTINDRLGHERGDDVLSEVGRRLLATVREVDTVARYGGDEFVVICDEADEDAVVAIAERVRAGIREPFAFLPGDLPLSASVGVAIGDDGPVPIDALIRAADLAMYRAKAEGGDRVVVGRSRLY